MFPFILITKSTEPRVFVTVLFWVVIVLLAGLGGFCPWAASKIQSQPTADVVQVALAYRMAKWCGGIIVGLFVIRYLVRRQLGRCPA